MQRRALVAAVWACALAASARVPRRAAVDFSFIGDGDAGGPTSASPPALIRDAVPRVPHVAASSAAPGGRNIGAPATYLPLQDGVPVRGAVAYKGITFYQLVVPLPLPRMDIIAIGLSGNPDLYATASLRSDAPRHEECDAHESPRNQGRYNSPPIGCPTLPASASRKAPRPSYRRHNSTAGRSFLGPCARQL